MVRQGSDGLPRVLFQSASVLAYDPLWLETPDLKQCHWLAFLVDTSGFVRVNP